MRIETTVGSSTRIEPGHPAGLVLSVLYDTAAGSMSRLRDDPPACFADLYLDQVIAGVVAGREDYHLEPFYYSSLSDVSAICYRHEVFQDLEQPLLFSRVKAFVEQMVTLRHYLAFATKFDYQPERQRWFLDAARLYCAAIAELLTTLQTADLSSRALLALRDHLAVYSGSDPFRSLSTDADRMIDELSEVVYCVEIRGGRVTVMKYEGEPDYSAQVAETFARFRQGAVSEYRTQVMNRVDMNHVEGQIIERVAKLFPDVFGNLEQFCETHQGFVDPTVATFDREIQFYLSYLEFIAPMRSASLEFCYPTMSETSKAECAVDSFDVALARLLVPKHSKVVTNSFVLSGPERVMVVTGPNQGGKTTFARTVGQLHHLANLGCPVPGREASLFLVDKVLTHFEKEEALSTQSGKLQDDLSRIRDLLDEATSRSLVVLNEIFTSTTLQDALFLGKEVLERVIAQDLLCVCVTFVDELATLGPSTMSMVSTVLPEDPTVRTFKIVRRPADGKAYAIVLAEKYGLTYEQLRARMAR